jgi:hypothetical protein
LPADKRLSSGKPLLNLQEKRLGPAAGKEKDNGAAKAKKQETKREKVVGKGQGQTKKKKRKEERREKNREKRS